MNVKKKKNGIENCFCLSRPLIGFRLLQAPQRKQEVRSFSSNNDWLRQFSFSFVGLELSLRFTLNEILRWIEKNDIENDFN